MRAPALALALLAPALAGCLSADVPTAAVEPSALALPNVPAGARLESVPEGLRLLWDAVDLPFEATFDVPPGTTLVRATTKLAATEVPFVALLDDATGRRRCQPPVVESWSADFLGERTCVGLAAIDPLPTTWKVVAGGSADVAELVAVEFLAVPLEGPAASLDLSQLSMPAFDLSGTEVLKVESFDGTRLHVEVTRPDTDGTVPAIVISSPYNADARAADVRPQDATIKDWVRRGYAIVVADVRGYGESGGCVEVWSANEQKDQAALVEWTAAQPWSDGNVGFYGQSYVATTPVAAAVHAPEALKAIVAVAPVTDAYWDWHFGGVPNGENVGSPIGYQTTYGVPAEVRAEDPLATALNHANGLCDPTLAARANDPRAVYDGFYAERNFSARAGDVTAAVLYTQGFEDTNVKSRMISDWFNALPGAKLGLFGHWVHQHPPRADQEVLFLAWFDQHLKGKPVGLERLADAYVLAQDGTERAVDAWPPTDAAPVRLFADLAGRKLAAEPPAEGDDATVVLDEVGPLTVAGQPKPAPPNSLLALDGEVQGAWRLAGTGGVRLVGDLPLGGNAHVAAFLWEGDVLVTWGMFNLAHRNGHDAYAPLAGGEDFDVFLPFLPTEYAFTPGEDLRLEVRASQTGDWFLTPPSGGVALTLYGGADGTALVLPIVDGAEARATSAPFVFGQAHS